MSNMGQLLQAQGKLAEAALLYREALTKAEAKLGLKHPLTKLVAENHVRCLDALARHDEATAVRKQFGLSNPATRPTTATATRPAASNPAAD
jgi:hypothetical protein